MSLPLRSLAKVTWYGPMADKSSDAMTTVGGAGKQGFSYTRWFIDPRGTGDLFDPSKPPTPTETYFRNMTQTTTNSFWYVPELRGACFPPFYVPTDPQTYLCPSDSQWQTPRAGGLPDWGVSTNWMRKIHNARGGDMIGALWTPQDTSTIGYLRTRSEVPADTSFLLRYVLYSQDQTETSTKAPKRRGLVVYLGVLGSQARWAIDLREAHTELGSDTYFHHNAWSLYRYVDNAWIREDVAPTSSFGSLEPNASVGTMADDELRFFSIGGYFLMGTRSMPSAWLYTTKGSSGADKDYGAYYDRSYIGIEVHNCRAWIALYPILFSSKIRMQTPPVSYARTWDDTLFNWKTGDMDFGYKDNRYLYGGTPGVGYTNTYVTNGDKEAYYDFTVSNLTPSTVVQGIANVSGRTTTPIFYFTREIHNTILETNTLVDSPVDISEFVEDINITLDESGRGHTGSITLRDFTIDAYTGAYATATNTTPSRICRGMGRVKVEFNHYTNSNSLAEGKTTAFIGYCSGMEYDDSGVFPMMKLNLQDRTALWNNGRATMWRLPNLAGTNFVSAMNLVLSHWGVDTNNDVSFYPGMNADIPLHDGSAILTFDDSEDIQNVLDRICDLCDMKWLITKDNVVAFDPALDPNYYSYTSASAALVVNPTVADSGILKVEAPVTVSRDFNESWNRVYVEGNDPRGNLISSFAIAHGLDLTSSNYPLYTGRPLWLTRQEPDNTNPALTVVKMARELAENAQTVQVSAIGSNVLPEDIVWFTNTTNLGPDVTNSLMKVRGKSSSVSFVDGDSIWTDEYTCSRFWLGG